MNMHTLARSNPTRITAARIFGHLGSVAVLCLCSLWTTRAHAAATLLLEEPYGYDGAFAGTGHTAIYLSNICAITPTSLRPCEKGETGVVLSRYDGIANRDWVAIPLLPYLYAVNRPESIPLFADAKMVAFLRDQYRRDYLETLAPDRADGSTPEGNWYEMVGASYDRTIYGFEIETSPEQDAELIAKLNAGPNTERYNVVKRNCADFVRQIVDFYYPHAVHRALIGDLGVTTPKQIAKMLGKYSHHHPELQSSILLVPQVPGTVRRSKPVHGVLESVVAAKKYMVPILVLHPYIAGGLLAGYFGQRFDPAKGALILDSARQLDAPITRTERSAYLSRLDEMTRFAATEEPGDSKKAEGSKSEAKAWERMLANADVTLDDSGQPVVQLHLADGPRVIEASVSAEDVIGKDVTSKDGFKEDVIAKDPMKKDVVRVGASRSNILSVSESSELAAGLVEARLRQELHSSTARKTSHRDVEKDLALLRQLLAIQPRDIAATPTLATRPHVEEKADLQ